MFKFIVLLATAALIQADGTTVAPQTEAVEDSCEYLDNGCPADFSIHLLLPHETSCRKFYICSNGDKILSNCSQGSVFNPNIQNCGPLGSIDRTCEDEDSSSEEEEEKEEVESSEEVERLPNGCPVDWSVSTYLPHEYYCNLYYQCAFGQLLERRCSNGTHFNPAIQNCDFIATVGCTLPGGDASLEVEESEDISTTTGPPIEFLENGCPVDGSITWLLPHEDDCGKFYYCVWGSLVVTNCAGNTHFSFELQRCDSPSVAGCLCDKASGECGNDCTGDDCDNNNSECTGDDCNNNESECTGDDCDNNVSECTGDDCDNNVSECTGDDCDNNESACTGDDCDNNVSECTGDNCNNNDSACTGDDCDSNDSACTGDDCDNNVSECTGDNCDNNDSACTGDDCDNNISECTGNDCDNNNSTCTGDNCDNNDSLCTGEDCDNNDSTCTGDDCDNNDSVCTGNDCDNDDSVCTGDVCDNNVSSCTGDDCDDNSSEEDLPISNDSADEDECKDESSEANNNKCEEDCHVLPWAHEDCDKYWRCHDRTAVLVVCSEGLHFNPKTYTCDFACNVGCVRENIQTTSGPDGLRVYIPWNQIDNKTKQLLKLISN